MNYVTHTIGGVGFGIATVSVMGLSVGVQGDLMGNVVIVGAMIGSVLIDIDHAKSFVSHKIPVISFVTSRMFKHRGFLHTPLFIALFTAALMFLAETYLQAEYIPIAKTFSWGLCSGMLSHICLDTLNKQGILWLYPFSKKRFKILGIRTHSMAEVGFSILMSFFILWRFIPHL